VVLRAARCLAAAASAPPPGPDRAAAAGAPASAFLGALAQLRAAAPALAAASPELLSAQVDLLLRLLGGGAAAPEPPDLPVQAVRLLGSTGDQLGACSS